MTRLPNFHSKQSAPAGEQSPSPQTGLPITQADFCREADRILLGRFPPASVLVNTDLEILLFRGRTRPYLEPAQGAATFNLLRMANESLFLILRDAVREARAGNTVVEKHLVRVRDEGRVRTIHLEVIPVNLPVSRETCFLILFLDEAPQLPAIPVPANAYATALATADSGEIRGLRREVESLREFLQSVQDRHDDGIEELRSANEEILASNEELQTANEDLSKANEEIALRSLEMGALSNDLNNLLDSINIPVLIVGGDLRIRRFTAAAAKSLRLIAADVGRNLGDLHFDLEESDLDMAVRQVIETADPQDHEVRNREGRWQSLRIHPWKASDGSIHGVVIILMDIDVLKTYQDKLQDAQEYASSIVATVRVPLLILRYDLRVNSANASFHKVFGTSPEESEGQSLFRMGDGIWDVPGLKQRVEDCVLRDEAFDGFEMAFTHPVTGPRKLSVNGRTLLREEGKSRMVLLSMEDITDRKRAHEILTNQSVLLERAVKERTAELQASNEGMEAFSYSVSHDLRAPLRAMRGYAESLLEDSGDMTLERRREYLRKIVASGDRLDHLITDVLTFSRATHSAIRIHAVNLDALIGQIVRAESGLHGPGVNVAIAGPLASVMAHETSLGQCLSNLLQNAVKFVAPGTVPSVRVLTERIGPDVRIWVEDNGIGIELGQHERIFGMFEKLDAGNTYPGTGIGLAIVRKSVERMGGKAGVESFLGAGSRFWLQFPKAPGN